jgi:hypothetical protein
MMQLPPGCTVAYEIRITVEKLTDEICEWFELQEGRCLYDDHGYLDRRGVPFKVRRVQYGKAKPSHTSLVPGHDKQTLIRFHGDDAVLATVFLLKFGDIVLNHNMEETIRRYEQNNP